MSNEKMEFLLPCVFTVGPMNKHEEVGKFAKYLMYKDEEEV